MFETYIALLLECPHDGFVGRFVTEQSNLPEFFTQEFVVCITEEFTHERIDVDDPAVGKIENQDSVLGRFKQPSVSQLGFMQGDLGLLDVMDVRV